MNALNLLIFSNTADFSPQYLLLENQILTKNRKLYRQLLFSFDNMKNKSFKAIQMKVRIVNIVISSDLKNKLILNKINAKLPHTEYNPDRFPGLILKIKEPRSSILLFTNGKIVCTGTKSFEKAEEAVNNLIKMLNKTGYNLKLNPILHVQNQVAFGELKIGLNLNQLAMKLIDVEYEPEQFPGLVHRIKEPKSTFLLFSNGKFVCTGTKNKKELDYSINKLIEDLKKVKAIK